MKMVFVAGYPPETVKCACGCGTVILRWDRKGRERRFVSGPQPEKDKARMKRDMEKSAAERAEAALNKAYDVGMNQHDARTGYALIACAEFLQALHETLCAATDDVRHQNNAARHPMRPPAV
jgi:hypothetical protein